jgi:hypothetical protein
MPVAANSKKLGAFFAAIAAKNRAFRGSALSRFGSNVCPLCGQTPWLLRTPPIPCADLRLEFCAWCRTPRLIDGWITAWSFAVVKTPEVIVCEQIKDRQSPSLIFIFRYRTAWYCGSLARGALAYPLRGSASVKRPSICLDAPGVPTKPCTA